MTPCAEIFSKDADSARWRCNRLGDALGRCELPPRRGTSAGGPAAQSKQHAARCAAIHSAETAIRVPPKCRGLALVLGWRSVHWCCACFWHSADPQKGTMKFTGVTCHFQWFTERLRLRSLAGLLH